MLSVVLGLVAALVLIQRLHVWQQRQRARQDQTVVQALRVLLKKDPAPRPRRLCEVVSPCGGRWTVASAPPVPDSEPVVNAVNPDVNESGEQALSRPDNLRQMRRHAKTQPFSHLA